MKLNEKDNFGDYPLLRAISYNKIEIVKLLLEYALQHQIILKLHVKNNFGRYPFLRAYQ